MSVNQLELVGFVSWTWVGLGFDNISVFIIEDDSIASKNVLRHTTRIFQFWDRNDSKIFVDIQKIL